MFLVLLRCIVGFICAFRLVFVRFVFEVIFGPDVLSPITSVGVVLRIARVVVKYWL